MPPTGPTASPLILIADDCADLRHMLAALLGSEGYRTETVANGADALIAMRRDRPDLVLLDLMMPVLSGWEVLEARRENPDLRDIALICLSSSANFEAAVRDYGADCALSKPVDADALIETVRRHCPSDRPPHPCACAERRTTDGDRRRLDARIARAVRRSEQLYRTLMEQASDGILILDGMLRCEVANARAAELFGIDIERLQSMNYRDLLAPDDRDGQPPIEVRCAPIVHERQFRRGDGSVIVAEVSSRTIESGRLTYVFIHDVTERRRLEEQLRQSQKMEALGRLAGGIAHDFANVLTSIVGLSDLLVRELGPETAAGRDAAQILAAGEKGAALTRQLLAFSRRQVVQLDPVDLNTVVQSVLALLQRLLPPQIDTHLHRSEVPALVEADPTKLEQVVLNLALNARDAMPAGGRLTIAIMNAPRSVHLVVADTGEGMDADTQAHIFEPFFTTKASGHGTGLGLATVYGVVQQLRGTIAVQSAKGAGTTFRIELPAAARSAAASRIASNAVRGTREKRRRVLVVEDDATVRAFASDVLRRAGYDVIDAAGPSDGIAAFRQHANADVIVTDVMMPGMTGIMMVEHMKRIRPVPPVLFMSAFIGHLPDGAHGRLPRHAEFLSKPFTASALLGAVDRTLLTAARSQHD